MNVDDILNQIECENDINGKNIYNEIQKKLKSCYGIIVNMSMFEITTLIYYTNPFFYDIMEDVPVDRTEVWVPFDITDIKEVVNEYEKDDTAEEYNYTWKYDKRQIKVFYDTKEKAVEAKLKYL